MKIIYKIPSENNFFDGTTDVIKENELIPEGWTDVEVPQPNYKINFNGTGWIENATEDEIKKWFTEGNSDTEPSEIDILKEQNAKTNLELLKLKIEFSKLKGDIDVSNN